jgi:hypothetical protein
MPLTTVAFYVTLVLIPGSILFNLGRSMKRLVEGEFFLAGMHAGLAATVGLVTAATGMLMLLR